MAWAATCLIVTVLLFSTILLTWSFFCWVSLEGRPEHGWSLTWVWPVSNLFHQRRMATALRAFCWYTSRILHTVSARDTPEVWQNLIFCLCSTLISLTRTRTYAIATMSSGQQIGRSNLAAVSVLQCTPVITKRDHIWHACTSDGHCSLCNTWRRRHVPKVLKKVRETYLVDEPRTFGFIKKSLFDRVFKACVGCRWSCLIVSVWWFWTPRCSCPHRAHTVPTPWPHCDPWDTTKTETSIKGPGYKNPYSCTKVSSSELQHCSRIKAGVTSIKSESTDWLYPGAYFDKANRPNMSGGGNKNHNQGPCFCQLEQVALSKLKSLEVTKAVSVLCYSGMNKAAKQNFSAWHSTSPFSLNGACTRWIPN